MPGLVQAGVDVSALLRLTGLFVGGEVWDDGLAVSVLAGMSGLQQLQLCDAPDFTDQGLLALAALTGLTKLRLMNCGLSAALVWPAHENKGTCFERSAQVSSLGA
jgi:hypothetical protein